MSEKVGSMIKNLAENHASHFSSEVITHDLLVSSENISKAITVASLKIDKSIGQFEGTLLSLLSSSTNTALIQMIFVAIAGAFSAYLFNWFHWRMAEKKKKVSRISSELLSVINDLESISTDYWVRGYKEEDKEDIHIKEALIKSKVKLIPRYIKIIIPELKARNIEQKKEKLENFGMNIFEWATGDDFESKNRKPLKGRASKIINKCSDIKATILHLDLYV